MKIIIWVSIVLLVGLGLILFLRNFGNQRLTPNKNDQSQNIQPVPESDITVLAQKLDTPWAIAFLPPVPPATTSAMLVTERAGRVRLIDAQGKLQAEPLVTINSVKEIGEGGLLGIDIDPNFSTNRFVYLYYTYQSSGENTFNRVVRMTYSENKLVDETVVLDQIPGASNHNGGRIKFGPDQMLYIGTGDAQEPSEAQNKNSLAGKILRVTTEGKPAPGNPFNNPVFSLGHRNVQGLAFNSDGQLWATEHGRSGIQSGFDELNLIESGKNYGWPEIQGDQARSGMEVPKKQSGSTTTWAPSGAAFLNNSLFFSGLRGQSLYKSVIQNNQVTDLQQYFYEDYGRIREVIIGPDQMLYITTSNRDGRAIPKEVDDQVIKLNPKTLF